MGLSAKFMKHAIDKERVLFIVFIVLVTGVFATAAFSRVYMNQYTQMLQASVSDRLIQTAKSLGGLVSKDELDRLVRPEDAGSATYAAVRERLFAFAEYNDLVFAYYMRLADGEYTYIIDNDQEAPVGVGEATPPDTFIAHAFGGEALSTVMGTYAGVWNGLMSAYAPMFDERGEVYAVACVDISDETMVRMLRQNQSVSVAFICLLAAVIVVGAFLIIAMRKRAAEYYAASMAKSDFLSRMSHDIRTPLNAIIGLSRMAGESGDVAEIHALGEKVVSSSTYLLSLINNILDISKIEAGRMTLENAEIDLGGLLRSVHTMVFPQAQAKGIDIKFETAGAVPPQIMGDATHLTQVFMNLLGNAVKFTPEGGAVTLAARTLGHEQGRAHLEFAVCDTGVGIAPENIARLFKPFEQEDGSTTRMFGGTGLGLAISKLLVEMMGGRIGVKSERGGGSTFTFDIWADVPSAVGAAAGSGRTDGVIESQAIPVGSAPKCDGKLFLLVEDNDINQLIAENMFEGIGAIIKQIPCIIIIFSV